MWMRCYAGPQSPVDKAWSSLNWPNTHCGNFRLKISIASLDGLLQKYNLNSFRLGKILAHSRKDSSES